MVIKDSGGNLLGKPDGYNFSLLSRDHALRISLDNANDLTSLSSFCSIRIPFKGIVSKPGKSLTRIPSETHVPEGYQVVPMLTSAHAFQMSCLQYMTLRHMHGVMLQHCTLLDKQLDAAR